jgi:diacylglycerol kinase
VQNVSNEATRVHSKRLFVSLILFLLFYLTSCFSFLSSDPANTALLAVCTHLLSFLQLLNTALENMCRNHHTYAFHIEVAKAESIIILYNQVRVILVTHSHFVSCPIHIILSIGSYFLFSNYRFTVWSTNTHEWIFQAQCYPILWFLRSFLPKSRC